MSRNLTTDDIKTIYELVGKLSPEWTDAFAVDDSEGAEKPKKLTLAQLKALFTPYNGATNDVDLGDKIISARKGLFENVVNNLTTDEDGYIADARQLKVLNDLITALKGVGWTDENLVDHEERIVTLNADDTTEGSVAKTVKDAVEPIDTRLTGLDTLTYEGITYMVSRKIENGHLVTVYTEVA